MAKLSKHCSSVIAHRTGNPSIRELDARDELIAELRRELSPSETRSRSRDADARRRFIQVAKDGRLDDAHLELCRSALRDARLTVDRLVDIAAFAVFGEVQAFRLLLFGHSYADRGL
jgi:hypothetical protein